MAISHNHPCAVTNAIATQTAAMPKRSNFESARKPWLPSNCHTGVKLNRLINAPHFAIAA